MWKRYRALNALAGHNISTVHMDHTGVPHLLEMPAAARHCGEVCHLVNERGETEKCRETNGGDNGTLKREVKRVQERRTARTRCTK